MIEETIKTEAEAGAALAQKPLVEDIEGVPYLLLPSGHGAWESQNLHGLLLVPTRKKGTTQVHEIDSFISVVEYYKTGNDDQLIYLDVDYAASHVVATAVFNDHGTTDAGWRDHRAVFEPRTSVEWQRWTAKDRQKMEQVELAHFFEENIGDITTAESGSKTPSGSDVLAFVSQLEETRKVKYGSGVNLQNGMVQLQFIEEGEEGVRGKLDLFREFTIGLRPFRGGDAYQVRAFLRYRIDRNTGDINFSYELQRPDRVLEDATKTIIQKIVEETGVTVIYGTP